MIFIPSQYRMELKIEHNIGENWSYKKSFAGCSQALHKGQCVQASNFAQ